jgi:hypothetical protein
MAVKGANIISESQFDETDATLIELHEKFQKYYVDWKASLENLRQMRLQVAERVGLPFGDASGLCEELRKMQPIPISDFIEKERQEEAILHQSGYPIVQARVDAIHESVGRIVNQIFATRAYTLKGLAVKIEVLHLALGRRGSQEDGDEDLEAFQAGASEAWFDSLARDIRQMTASEV